VHVCACVGVSVCVLSEVRNRCQTKTWYRLSSVFPLLQRAHFQVRSTLSQCGSVVWDRCVRGTVLAQGVMVGVCVAAAVEERNLFSVAYKNVVGRLRSSWRAVSSICEKEARASADEWKLQETRQYRERIEGDLHDVCQELLTIVGVMLDGKGTRQPSEVCGTVVVVVVVMLVAVTVVVSWYARCCA